MITDRGTQSVSRNPKFDTEMTEHDGFRQPPILYKKKKSPPKKGGEFGPTTRKKMKKYYRVAYLCAASFRKSIIVRCREEFRSRTKLCGKWEMRSMDTHRL
jgi:hypothetical protein